MITLFLKIVSSIIAVLAILYSLFSYLVIRQQQTMGFERRKVSFTVAFITSTLFDALAVFAILFDSIDLALLFLSISLLLSLYGCYTRMKRITNLAQITENKPAAKRKQRR